MTTRAASLANSKRVKQNLVNLLFKSDYTKKGRDGHRKLDFASYSYMDLRDAYLKRIQSIHPDKVQHTNHTNYHQHVHSELNQQQHPQSHHNNNKNDDTPRNNDDNKGRHSFMDDNASHQSWNDETNWEDVRRSSSTSTSTSSSTVLSSSTTTNTKKQQGHDAFIELQEAWDKYDKIARMMQRGKTNSQIRGVQEDFTLFGVGCSFSDNDEERQRRIQIMDQAGKGWFAAGQLLSDDTDGATSTSTSTNMIITNTSVTQKEGQGEEIVEKTHDWGKQSIPTDASSTSSRTTSLVSDELFSNNTQTKLSSKSKKSLIDHLIPSHKRIVNR